MTLIKKRDVENYRSLRKHKESHSARVAKNSGAVHPPVIEQGKTDVLRPDLSADCVQDDSSAE